MNRTDLRKRTSISERQNFVVATENERIRLVMMREMHRRAKQVKIMQVAKMKFLHFCQQRQLRLCGDRDELSITLKI